ncbi:Gamma-glutamyltransferase [Handroanthus impetiginosus]|uniref:Glutathione hydrolase n=1 Tax=Handroanthus impetiginosus TaxID=429701 RepID=A0A2G9GI04_9LAMI|nr:Gamma-glutamyltransferase [Handroanthus impetiginosus]
MFQCVCPKLEQILAIIFLSLSLAFPVKSADAGRGERVEVNNGVVATDETECSRIGRDTLARGGLAVDAAVAATLCIGVLGPADSGLGGGGFILVRSANGEAKVFGMIEMAPGRANKWKVSPLSIAVPGQLAGLFTVHKLYGKLPWTSLVKPAEALARKGFNVSRSLFHKMATAESNIMANEELRSIFAPNGQILNQGQTVCLRKLADTLAAIAKHGMKIFYNRSIAESLAEDIKRVSGIVTKEDFQKYQVITREPLVAHVLGYKILTVPPPASGGAVVILILKTLSKYKDKDILPTPLQVHRTIEALKYALALRMNLGDPEFVNITSTLKLMISNSTAEKLGSLIDDNKTFDPSHYGSKWDQLNDHGTNHICIVDRQHNVVSMTTSINTKWGSKVMSPSTGIFLNNQMYYFSNPTSKFRPGAPANFVSPFKRPLSSLSPVILEKGGRVRACIGSGGGLLIPDAVTQVLQNFFIVKKPSFDAVKAPRFYHRDYSSGIGDRYTYSSEILKELKKRGHHLRRAISGMTTCQFFSFSFFFVFDELTTCQSVVQILEGSKNGQLVAISDPRKGGFPAGY